MSSSRTQRYTREQVYQIYDRIHLRHPLRHEPGEESRAIANSRNGLEFLTALQRYMLCSVPFENLELHYSRHKTVSIFPDDLFDKIVTQGTGRGGYCMENNMFFAALLRSLEFNVMSTGARVNLQNQPTGDKVGEERYGGWGHMVNIVTIQGQRYLVDVGFGSGGITHPIPVVDGEESLNIPPSQHVRLRWDTIPQNDNPAAKLWIYERRMSDNSQWLPVYCFPDNVEFLPGDFGMMNFSTSTNRASFFTYKVLCAKFVMDEQKGEIVGDVVLFEKGVHTRTKGVKEELAKFEREAERVEALKKYLGVTLTETQKAGIKGMVTALPS